MDRLNSDIYDILNASHSDPYGYFGLRVDEITGYLTMRTFQPNAKKVSVVSKATGKVVNRLTQVDKTGIFSIQSRRKKYFDYWLKIDDGHSEQLIDDPFAFSPILTDLDIHLLLQGNHKKVYEKSCIRKIMGQRQNYG